MPREHLLVAGSSTVFPFAAAVAERAGGSALVMPLGSGAGIAWFCEGAGPSSPDVAMSSRLMTPEEASLCRVHGAGPVTRYEIGRDGVVLAGRGEDMPRALSLRELWLALAARVPGPDGWIENPYRQWRDIRPDLPAAPIRVLGPQATSGTRDSFVELALKPPCAAAVRATGAGESESRRCGELRRDDAWLDAPEDDEALVARLLAGEGTLGVVGFGAYARHGERLAAACIGGSCPQGKSIADGSYPLSRSLYLYVKATRAAVVPGLQPFVDEFYSPPARGGAGYLANMGLVPGRLPGAEPVRLGGQDGSDGAGSQGWALGLAASALAIVMLALATGFFMARRQRPLHRPWERGLGAALGLATALVGLLLTLVLVTLAVPALQFFIQVSPLAFLGGTHWSPESAIRAAQVVGEGAFGVLPVLLGSVVVAAIALLFALPVAGAAALHGFTWGGSRRRNRWRRWVRLAALMPTVIYGLFAAVTVGPGIAAAVSALGGNAGAQTALAAGLVVGIMLLPVLALRIGEALEAVPRAAPEAALGLGATRWEALRDIILPGAAPGIAAAVLLAVARALGETVIVLMAAGWLAHLSIDPLAPTTTLTAQAVVLMSGTHELDHVRTQLPFVLGLFLALLVLPLNGWALRLAGRSGVAATPVY